MTMNDMMKNLQRMTSLEIAQVTGKMHKDVMKAIRNMEPAWEQERGRKFALTQLRVDIPNGGYRLRPVYMPTSTRSSSRGTSTSTGCTSPSDRAATAAR